MLVYVEVSGMRTQVLQEREPALRGRSLVVLDGRRVADLSAEAAAAGLHVGDELSPAALLNLGALWRRDPGAETCQDLQDALGERLLLHARSWMDCGTGAAAAEMWPGTDPGAVLSALRGLGWWARIASGRSLHEAQALVRGGARRLADGGEICAGERQDLPLTALGWVPGATIRRLERLGMTRVGDLSEIGPGTLWEQIGASARELSAFVRGEEPTGYRPEAEAPELGWRRRYDGAPCEAQAELVRAVSDGLEALSARRGGLPAIGAVEVRLADEAGEETLRRRELLRPTRQRARLEATVLGLALTAVHGPLREISLRLTPSRAEAAAQAEPGLFYPVRARAPKPRIVAVPQLPARERRLAFFDPYRRTSVDAVR
ncbi:MAG: hypothetical protein M0Z66_03545 [Thermaerobacter sp.]|nr:hypothetical protein [Thermaerobacter sp.]